MKITQFRILSFMMLLHISSIELIAQGWDKLSFSTEYTVKFPVGEEVRKTILYEPGFTVNYPTKSTFDFPVYCLEFSPSYALPHNFIIGVTGGIAVSMNEGSPLTGGVYFNQVMFPVHADLGYVFDLGKEFHLIPEYKIGYQFLQAHFGSTDEGFIYELSGGMMMALDLGVTKKIGKYYPSFNIGYEVSQIRNEMSFGWVDGYDYEDKFDFNTAYHFFKAGIGIKF